MTDYDTDYFPDHDLDPPAHQDGDTLERELAMNDFFKSFEDCCRIDPKRTIITRRPRR